MLWREFYLAEGDAGDECASACTLGLSTYHWVKDIFILNLLRALADCN